MKETYSRSKSVWQRMNARERKAAMAYGEKYKAFLDTARTERLAAAEIIRRAEEKGFKPVYHEVAQSGRQGILEPER